MEDTPETWRRVLDFEGRWYRHAGAKEAAIRDEFGWTAARYYQTLNDLVDDPDALAYAPVTIRRLQRVREQLRLDRSTRK